MAKPVSKAKKMARPTRIAASAARSTFRDDVRAFKREVIITAATDLFYRVGYQTATVDDIAVAISATKAVVYYYFDTKEAVLEAIVDRCTDLARAAVERGINSGATPIDKLALGCFCFAANVLNNQKMIGVYFREERCFSAAQHARATESETAITSKLADVIAAGIKSGDFRAGDAQLMALNVSGMISMAFHWYREHGRLSEVDLCRYFAAEALHFVGYKGEVTLERWLSKLPA